MAQSYRVWMPLPCTRAAPLMLREPDRGRSALVNELPVTKELPVIRRAILVEKVFAADHVRAKQVLNPFVRLAQIDEGLTETQKDKGIDISVGPVLCVEERGLRIRQGLA